MNLKHRHTQTHMHTHALYSSLTWPINHAISALDKKMQRFRKTRANMLTAGLDGLTFSNYNEDWTLKIWNNKTVLTAHVTLISNLFCKHASGARWLNQHLISNYLEKTGEKILSKFSVIFNEPTFFRFSNNFFKIHFKADNRLSLASS